MRTDFYNMNTKAIMMNGETIEKVYIYGNGQVLAELEQIKEHEIKNEMISEVYDGDAQKVFLDTEIKKAVKLNLNRSDSFYIKNPEKKYSIDRQYVLYIHESNVFFENAGEVLATKFEHEENYLQAYRITFPCVEFKRMKVEKIPTLENYTLKDGECFSETCYGSDKEHACVWSYDHSNNSLFAKKHPERANEKGIIKRWFETETVENCEILLTKRCYVRTEKDNFRKNSISIAEDFEKILNKSISYYDIEKLLENYNITRK